MAGYDDTYQMIISTLMGRPAGEEIQPDEQQAYEINMLNYIRSLELLANGPLIGIATPTTQPVQPNNARACYISGVAQDRTVTFQNFRNYLGQPIQITNGQMEACLVILIWDTQYWSAETVPTSIISAAENANFYYNYNVKKTYASVAAMNADENNPIGTDGKYIQIGDIVSVVNSTTPSENGVYSYTGSGWTYQSSYNFQVSQVKGDNPNTAPSLKLFTDEVNIFNTKVPSTQLIPLETLEGYYINSSGVIVTTTTASRYVDKYSVKEGAEYSTIVKTGSSATMSVAFYKDNNILTVHYIGNNNEQKISDIAPVGANIMYIGYTTIPIAVYEKDNSLQDYIQENTALIQEEAILSNADFTSVFNISGKYINKNTGNEATSVVAITTDFLPLENMIGDKLIVKGASFDYSLAVNFYDSDKNFISTIGIGTDFLYIDKTEFPVNAKYVRINGDAKGKNAVNIAGNIIEMLGRIEPSEIYLANDPSQISINTTAKTITITGGYYHSQKTGGVLPVGSWSYANVGSLIFAVFLSDYKELVFRRIGETPNKNERYLFSFVQTGSVNSAYVSGLQNYTLNGTTYSNYNPTVSGAEPIKYGLLTANKLLYSPKTRTLDITTGIVVMNGARTSTFSQQLVLSSTWQVIYYDTETGLLASATTAQVGSYKDKIIVGVKSDSGLISGFAYTEVTTNAQFDPDYWLQYGHRSKILTEHYVPPTKTDWEFVEETNTFTATLYSRFDALVAQYPNYVSGRVLGQDETGTDIKCYEFIPTGVKYGNSQYGGLMYKVMTTSNHHGWEKNGTICNLWFFELLCSSNDELIKWMRNHIHFITVPMMNPYGAITGTRQNQNGVDLNRNYSIGWTLTEPGTATYGGTEPFSELATQFVKSVIDSNTDIRLFIDFHNFSRSDEGMFWVPSSTKLLLPVARDTFGETFYSIQERYPNEFSEDFRIGYANMSSNGMSQAYASAICKAAACTFEVSGGFQSDWDKALFPERMACHATMALEGYINFIKEGVFRT